MMSLVFFLFLCATLMVCHGLDVVVARPIERDAPEMRFSSDENKAIVFLRRYGYLPAERNSGLPVTRALFTNALNNYQVMASVPIKDRLDRTVLDSMEGPRCANPDVRRSDGLRVARFEIHAPAWSKGNLTYRISRYPTRHLTRPLIDQAMRKAMLMWSNISHIDFIQVPDNGGRVDIDIKFENSNYDTTCDIYFRVGELAHATLTRSPAKVHFNGRVSWKIGGIPTEPDVDLVSVAAHEIGHVLGLDHSADRNALMYASYKRQNSDLGRDDIQAVQYLYGSRRGSSVSPSRPTPKPEPPREPQDHGQCPVTITRKMPDGRRTLCAAVYKESRCQGQRLPIESGNRTSRLDGSWDNEISSAEVNPGCTLKVCHRSFFTGGCIDLEGGTEGKNLIRMPLGFNEMITSLACICDEQNDDRGGQSPPAGDQILERNREPPPFIPNTDRVPTCAVMVVNWERGSTRAWIEVETAMRMPSDLVGLTYTYLATRRGCTLFYCTKPAFDGICEFLGPSRHAQSNEGFQVASLSCECK